jgi:hypothetical protein
MRLLKWPGLGKISRLSDWNRELMPQVFVRRLRLPLIEGSGEAPGPSLSRLRKENTCFEYLRARPFARRKKKRFSVGPGVIN